MKQIIIIFSFLMTLNSCSDNDVLKAQENSIIGSWQLIEFIDGGSIGGGQLIENGDLIYFDTTMGFGTSEELNSCTSNPNGDGTYLVTDNKISIFIECPDNDIMDYNITYNYRFENGELFLEDDSNCDEGCTLRYKRISEEGK